MPRLIGIQAVKAFKTVEEPPPRKAKLSAYFDSDTLECSVARVTFEGRDEELVARTLYSDQPLLLHAKERSVLPYIVGP